MEGCFALNTYSNYFYSDFTILFLSDRRKIENDVGA